MSGVSWWIDQLAQWMSQWIVIPVVLGVGLFFTIFTGFVQIRFFPRMLQMLGEGFYHQDSDGNKQSGVSSFQAFAISIASRVGTGNLAGVAIAIVAGGPGSIFWMWLMALLGMASAFVESTLAQVYKVPARERGHFRGGPSFYLENALKSRKLAVFFSVLMMITFGYVYNMIQANTIASAFHQTFAINSSYVAVGVGLLAGVILLGGVQRIAKVSAFFVPFMALSYVVVGLFIMLTNVSNIPQVFKLIMQDAFTGRAAGVGVLVTMMHGIRRGLFSNEAGMGTAPAAAAAANTSHPVKQGLIQSFSVFTDTIIVSSMTAFIILSSGLYNNWQGEGIVLTQLALATKIGDLSQYYLVLIIFTFAFSSIIGNYFYAETSLAYITGDEAKAHNIFKVTVVLVIMWGAIAQSNLVWNLGDLFSGLMATVNLYAITRLFPIVKAVLDDFSIQVKAGKNPIFKRSSVAKLHDVACWED